jgi:glycosyltransferase involved in cell wall biosynthesis
MAETSPGPAAGARAAEAPTAVGSGPPVLARGGSLPALPPAVAFVSLPTGVGGSTRSLANLMDRLGGRATRVLAGPPGGRFVGMVGDRDLAEWHLPVVDPLPGLAPLRRARTALRLVRALRPHRRRVRAVHANGFNELAAALPAAIVWRLPVVVWVHNFTAGRAVAPMRAVWPLVRRRTEVRWAAVSPLARDLVAEAGLARAEDVAVVPNPIDPADVVAAERPPAGGPPTVAFLGTPRDYKGFQFLPDLVEKVAEREPVRWLLFTQQTDDHLPEVWDRLRALEAAGELTIAGKTTDVAGAYARCDVVVCPSVLESFCRVAAEAMLNGIPVAGSDLEPVRALLGDGEAGLLFPVGDLDAGADAIARLARDRQLRERLGREGRVRAAQFGPEVVGERFAQLLGLVDGAGAPGERTGSPPAPTVPAA